ncbi:hypothetical protein ATANTOWER_008962 [Ataeniobius toweri]|uniref:Uncharacterized protein n=1 Tax=Ataeniobius toweri TaxID=208326 RepID=A0ABU7APX3_9TELE|nr:hypothetical protein [Ataeniobius toweri]
MNAQKKVFFSKVTTDGSKVVIQTSLNEAHAAMEQHALRAFRLILLVFIMTRSLLVKPQPKLSISNRNQNLPNCFSYARFCRAFSPTPSLRERSTTSQFFRGI